MSRCRTTKSLKAPGVLSEQWALIHLEQAWAENRLEAEARLLHERADVVAFRPEPFPVEYKRGKRKLTEYDPVRVSRRRLSTYAVMHSMQAGALALPLHPYFSRASSIETDKENSGARTAADLNLTVEH